MDNQTGIVIIGASGHAKVVLSILLAMGESVRGFVDDNQELWESDLLRHPVLGPLSFLEEELAGAPVIFGIVDNAIRKIIAERYSHLNWKKAIHPRAIVDPSAQVSKGSIISAGAIIQPDVFIGDHSIVNTGATIDHDCIVGAYVHIAPGVNLAANIQIGEGCMLGLNSSVVPNIHIAEWATIGAGSVVLNNIPSQVVAFGVPAVVKEYFQEVSANEENKI